HPEVDVIAFTGSNAVGLEILKAASLVRPGQRNVKKVVLEMGGKNAIIVDDDADLDQAVMGVVASAFGYAGQKCSACSRVVVVGSAYPEFRARLAAAVESLVVGPPEDPYTYVPPVISAEAKERITSYIVQGLDEATLVARREAPAGRPGHYVAPHVFEDVDPGSRMAREEIFGPVLAMFRADTFDEALRAAMDSAFALTGGVYSRNPAHILRAREEFRVGNLYINRKITGAVVGRQPFGGMAMSGAGDKAGGPDYLAQFVVPRVVTENTVRRGFAPERGS
ncbi:MAG: aldehyde dehydrogenase family protein, partial [Hyphomicrobiales bacterium]